MADETCLGDTPYKLPPGVQDALDFEQQALAEYRQRKPRCNGADCNSDDHSCCLAGLTALQIEAVKALIASFPAQDDQPLPPVLP